MSASNARNRMAESAPQSEGMGASAMHQAREYMEHSKEYIGQGREFLGEYPLSSTAVAFGLGVGVGLLMAMAMTEPPRPTYSSRAEQMSRQILDSLASVLPDALSKRFS